MGNLKAPSTLVCAVWGPLYRGEHMDCPAIVNHPHEGVTGSPARTASLPIICQCECRTCKHAWWKAGRPIMRDGYVIYERST